MLWIVGLICIILLVRKLIIAKYKKQDNVSVVVLGDIGRSPRMQYHVTSLVKEGFTVDFIGYPGSLPLNEIRFDPRICIYYLQPPPSLENYLPRTLCYIVKTVWQICTLFKALFSKQMSHSMLMQNPPAIPAMPVCWFYCILVGSEFIIDWHNYGYTIMTLSLGENHLLVKFAKWIESHFGIKAKHHFCVSQAMKDDLQAKWGIEAQVLYDRPADAFQPITLADKHDFLLKLAEKYPMFKGTSENATIFTEHVPNEVRLLDNRPGFIVSSTSWTEDEDFSILLEALKRYENAIIEDAVKLPDLICVITGKGPLKEFYTAIIELKRFKHIKIITPWLESKDYPKILASADLGICLHTSSSGLDLPMKVVDMFGCVLPVCAYRFNCLSELVRHNENSFIFSNEEELFNQLKAWFQNFPNNESQEQIAPRFRQELYRFQENRWHSTWANYALPYFNQRC